MSYSADDLVRVTGLPPETLRLWIRGYRVLGPRRRTYTRRHVEKLGLVERAVRAGHPLELAGRLSRRDLQRLLEGRNPQDYLADCLEALQSLDAKALGMTLRQGALRLPMAVFLEQLAAPLLETVGRMWESGRLSVATEHLISVVVRAELSRLLDTSALHPDAPAVVVTTPAGHRHELGALMASIVANHAGWRAVYLGADLPNREILRIARGVEARLVALSLVYPREDQVALAQICELHDWLAPRIGLVVGGQGSLDLEAPLGERGITAFSSFSAFEQFLREARSG